MTETEPPWDTLTGTEDPPRGLAPLRLGDPTEAVLEMIDRQDIGLIEVETAWRTVRLGRAGAELLSGWLERYLEKPSEGEPELWTASGISSECGVHRRTVYVWIEREDFPAAFAHPVGGAPVWLADAVRQWVVNDRPRAGNTTQGRPKAIRP